MSIFKKLGGGKKEAAPPSPQSYIQKLRDTEGMLIKKQEFLEKKIEQEIATAKKHGTKNKRLALHALQRKKQYEKQLQQIDGTLSTIEFQRAALENASMNTEVFSIMGEAAKALKGAHKHMDVDQVHNLMDDIAEQNEVANEISDAISNPTGFGQSVDEDELLAELEELEQEELDKNLLETKPVPALKLPSVPTSKLPAKTASSKSKDDHDLAALQAWAT